MTPILPSLDLVFREDLELAEEDHLGVADTVLHLRANQDGFAVARDGWVPGTLDEGSDRVPEAISLIVKGASHNDLATKIQALAQMVRQANQYKDGAEFKGVWLRSQLKNETGVRQALITKARHHAISPILSPYVNDGSLIQSYGLELERTPYWESDEYTEFVIPALDAIGGTHEYTGSGTHPVLGDHPARIAECQIYGVTGGVVFERFWLGFRSDRWGDPYKFAPIWNLRKSAYFGADTTGATANYDTSAKDNYKVITTFATHAEMLRRATMTMHNHCHPDEDLQRGVFTVLLRARITPSGTAVCQVQLADGNYSTDDEKMRIQDRVTISQNTWRLYELGTVQMPAVKVQTSLEMNTLAILAERISGSAYLEMDCLILIPVSEGFISCDNFQITGSNAALLYQTADGAKYGSFTASGTGYMALSPKASGGLPVGLTKSSASRGYAVLAGQRYGYQSVKSDEMEMILWVYSRYDQLRGAA